MYTTLLVFLTVWWSFKFFYEDKGYFNFLDTLLIGGTLVDVIQVLNIVNQLRKVARNNVINTIRRYGYDVGFIDALGRWCLLIMFRVCDFGMFVEDNIKSYVLLLIVMLLISIGAVYQIPKRYKVIRGLRRLHVATVKNVIMAMFSYHRFYLYEKICDDQQIDEFDAIFEQAINKIRI